MPRRNTPDHSCFDSVITQLELSVVSQLSDGREKEHLPNKVVRYTASSATNSVRPQRRTTRRERPVWARELDIYGRIGAQG